MLVVVHNLLHLTVAHGLQCATAAMHRVRQQAGRRGATVECIGEDSLLVSLSPQDQASPGVQRRLVEAWLCASLAEPVQGVAYPVISVGLAHVARTPLPGSFHVERLGPDSIGGMPAMPHSLAWRLNYKIDMARALEFFQHLSVGRVSLAFQPVVTCTDPGRLLYREALLRIGAPPHGHCREPADVLPALERLGLMRLVDRCVLLAVLTRLRADPTLRLGCNLSAQSLVLDGWWSSALHQLAASPAAAARLTLEITETALPPDRASALLFVGRLQALGCRIAVDDFGAGHTTIDFVRRLRPDVVKLDAGLLHAARDAAEGAALLRAMVGLARQLAPRVVMEGVECDEDLQRCIDLRLDAAQGRWLGAPAAGAPAVPLMWSAVAHAAGRQP